jgi:hypothetical protein
MSAWRDVRATVITLIGLVLAFSVTQGWGWAVLGGSARAGIAVLMITGLAVCGTSSWTAGFSWRDPFLVTGVAAGIVLLVAGVIGLFVDSMEYLVVMMVATGVIWLVATTRHLVEGPRAGPAPTA